MGMEESSLGPEDTQRHSERTPLELCYKSRMETRDWIGPKEIGRILSVTDAMGLHREAVRVPLDCEEPDRLEIVSRVLVVVAPKTGAFDAWVDGLEARIKSVPGVHLLKRSESPPLG